MNVNRAFVYGDLLFETIKVWQGKIQLPEYHFRRLSLSARFLGFELPANWSFYTFETTIKNSITSPNQRIRLIIHRMAPGFYNPQNNQTKLLVDVWPLPKEVVLHERIDFYERDFKACTPLSNHKTGNALIYVLASMYAEQMEFDDVLILNQHGRIADATSSNLFIIKNNQIITPPNIEAGIMGVYRQYLLDVLPKGNFNCIEKPISLQDVLDADECFLTNAIQGIVGVKKCRSKLYSAILTNQIKQYVHALN